MKDRYSKLVFWEKPKNPNNIENSLADAIVSLKPGMMLVYRRAAPNGIRMDKFNQMVANLATRLGCALVQFPERPSHGDQDAVRVWNYAIQKAGA